MPQPRVLLGEEPVLVAAEVAAPLVDLALQVSSHAPAQIAQQEPAHVVGLGRRLLHREARQELADERVGVLDGTVQIAVGALEGDERGPVLRLVEQDVVRAAAAPSPGSAMARRSASVSGVSARAGRRTSVGTRTRGRAPPGAQRRPQPVGVELAALGDGHHVLVADELAGVLGDGGQRHLGRLAPALGGAQVGGGEDPLDAEPEERHGLLDGLAQGVGVGPGEVGRVAAGREGGDGHLDLVLALPLVDPLGRGLAGGVGVEGQHEPRGEALERADVLVGEGGAAGGDGPVEADLGEADHVGVALADDDLVGPHRLVLGPVEPVEDLALAVERGLRRVLVLGRPALGHHPPAEADGVALDVEDREQDPGPEEVVGAAPLALPAEAGVAQHLGRERQGLDQLVPVVGRPADLVLAHASRRRSPRSRR